MFTENPKNNITTNYYPRDLVKRTTLLIDLILGEHLQIWGERRGGMHKSGIYVCTALLSPREGRLTKFTL